MKKHIQMLLALMVAASMSVLTSCGGGVDQSNPQSVADAALECYDTGDYAKLKTLANPEDEYRQGGLDKLIKLSEAAKAKGNEAKYEKKERTFVSVTDKRSGEELTEESEKAEVNYEGDYPRRVILEKVNGKWYFDKFK